MQTKFYPIRNVRTEYGKQIRGVYEKHLIHEKRANMTEFDIKTDGISNTITTVQKDYLVLCKRDFLDRLGKP